ncbi:hypothetical protein GCK72_002147 [Caenorhabditis remanei]|uniref:Uncharacterized protein n=1 Tax=Caenorhabditis remanei TaxID=31234 RepID=A0A6A5HRK3_CAERE|nr:hypothetical protein GCK72_002147 [Caenorhabditis remanei]KAF1770329.1 hypothetical protein GCK72_002147 [Caenorhabditis remanei]
MTKKAVESFTNPLKHIPGLESGTEQLLHSTTISILAFLCVLLASKPLFGSPIVCQVPKDWPSSSVDYFTDMCYYGNRESIHITQVIDRGYNKGTMTVNAISGTSDFYMVSQVSNNITSLCYSGYPFYQYFI